LTPTSPLYLIYNVIHRLAAKSELASLYFYVVFLIVDLIDNSILTRTAAVAIHLKKVGIGHKGIGSKGIVTKSIGCKGYGIGDIRDRLHKVSAS